MHHDPHRRGHCRRLALAGAVVAAVRKKKPEAQAPLPLTTIAEGVHLNLPESEYFDAPALGSSDFHLLDKDPPSWWYASSFNPERREQRRKSRALAFGSALHALILEGEAAYARRFVVEPDGASNRWARSRDETLKLLEQVGYKKIPRGSDSFDTQKLVQAARDAGVADRVWDAVYPEYERAKKQGKAHITSDEDRRLRRMAHQVAQHPDLGPNLRAGLSEVSVFWRKPERPDILLRARFDKLLPKFTIDLKTFSNPRDESPPEATLSAICNEGYDLQAEHYRDARCELAKAVRERRVFCWQTDNGKLYRTNIVKDEVETLSAIAAEQAWLWVWIFYQVQSDDAGRERAPIVVPWYTTPSGQLFDDARATIERALDNYTLWVSRAGLAQPWSEVLPILPLPIDKLKRLAFKRTVQ